MRYGIIILTTLSFGVLAENFYLLHVGILGRAEILGKFEERLYRGIGRHLFWHEKYLS